MTLLQLAVFLSVIAASTEQQCMSPGGDPVDWYALYKLPTLHKSDPNIKAGKGVFYLDNKHPDWSLSSLPVDAQSQSLYQTLAPVYNNQGDKLMYLFYNDEPSAGRQYPSYGHTKGVLVFSSKSGFWLVHSIPEFPSPVAEGFQWPPSAHVYGQSVLCVSLDYNTLGEIGNQLFYNHPYIYDKNVPSSFMDDFPVFGKIINDEYPTKAPWQRQQTLTSLSGFTFVSFAKYSRFGADLYADLVAPALKTSLYVETWQHNGTPLPSNCSGPNQIFNIQDIGLPQGIDFKSTEDHSKWAVSTANQPWVCVGDINRTQSQFKRAGGTICFNHQKVWANYNSSISAYGTCGSIGNTLNSHIVSRLNG